MSERQGHCTGNRFRALWIQRLYAAVRSLGMTYSVFINGLAKSGITVDRKVLSDLAINEPAAFQAIKLVQGPVSA